MIFNATGLELPLVAEVNPNRENTFSESQPRPVAKRRKNIDPYTLCSNPNKIDFLEQLCLGSGIEFKDLVTSVAVYMKETQ